MSIFFDLIIRTQLFKIKLNLIIKFSRDIIYLNAKRNRLLHLLLFYINFLLKKRKHHTLLFLKLLLLRTLLI